MITETVILATSVGVFVKRRIRGGVRFWQNLLELEDIKRENKKLKNYLFFFPEIGFRCFFKKFSNRTTSFLVLKNNKCFFPA